MKRRTIISSTPKTVIGLPVIRGMKKRINKVYTLDMPGWSPQWYCGGSLKETGTNCKCLVAANSEKQPFAGLIIAEATGFKINCPGEVLSEEFKKKIHQYLLTHHAVIEKQKGIAIAARQYELFSLS